jgi:hypothetical protein
MTRFAEDTKVPVQQSRAEIERLLTKYGATKFMTFTEETRAVIGFVVDTTMVKIAITLPDRAEDRFIRTARTNKLRSVEESKRAYEQESRRIWRALALVVKAKLEAVESEISSFEQEFMPFIVTRDGRTLGEILLPRMADVTAGADVMKLLQAP